MVLGILNVKNLFLCLGMSIVLVACQSMETKKIKLAENEHILVGYGSLLNKQSLEKTFGGNYDKPYISAQLFGYQRFWNVFTPNEGEKAFKYLNGKDTIQPEKIIYLNIAETKPEDSLNVCLFVVNDEQLKAFDEREWVYNRVDVSSKIPNNPFEPNRPIWVYVGKKEYLIEKRDSVAVIRKTYVDLVQEGVKNWGKDFENQYNTTTENPKKHFVVEDLKAPNPQRGNEN
jgi:hypothetical protein